MATRKQGLVIMRMYAMAYLVRYTSETIDIKYYKFNMEEERLTDNGQVDEPEILTGDNLDNDYSTDDFDAGDRFTS
jgi:hypothetical protein